MMHRHKFLALTLAAGLAGVGTPALAQTGGTPAPAAPADSARHMKDPVSRLLEHREELKLTEDQARRLEEIRAKYQEKHKGQLEQLRRNREARAAFRASMDSARAEIAAVLTPEQEKQVEAMRREWRKYHGRKRHGHRGG
jgi:Spy/CpxP family protein refolding chaperone